MIPRIFKTFESPRLMSSPQPYPFANAARIALLLLIGGALWLGSDRFSHAAEGDDLPPAVAGNRIPWTTSRITGSPEPAPPYRTEHVYPLLKFKEPVTIARLPNSNRQLVMQLKDGIVSFVDEANPSETAPFFDFTTNIKDFWRAYGIAFHPQFAENRYCFVCYVLARGEPLGSRVSRFKVADADPPYLIPESEQVLIAWPSGGHNGGSIQFGADGYLYISTGDGSDPVPPDVFRTGQNLGDLRSKILRIDVNKTSGDLPYAVPADNPFVEVAEARPEVWAYGLRNPWKMVFDPTGKELWLGDVGWEMWEQIHRIVRGGNYGWSVMEASQPIHPESTRGPTAIVKPVVALSRSESLSITGGVFYQTGQLEELRGAYTYGDFITGTIWALKPEDENSEKLAWLKVLAQTTHEIIDFGTDRDGELLILDHGGTIHKLVTNETADRSQDFPRKLSETGLFANVKANELAPGVKWYNIAASSWADEKFSEFFLALPGVSQIELHVDRAKWVFPKDTVLGKTIGFWMKERHTIDSHRRIETQLMHFDGIRWNGYTYAWNDEQNDGELVPLEGMQRKIDKFYRREPEGPFTHVWHFQSRSQCGACHNRRVNFTVAFDALQLEGVHGSRELEVEELQRYRDSGIAPPFESQFETFVKYGYFTGEHPKSELVLCDPHDSTKPTVQRARSYLHANCAHCHRHGGGGNAQFKLQYDFDLTKAGYIGTRPVVGTFGLPRPAVIAPGDPFRSALYYRMAKNGAGRMPHIGAEMIDPQGLHLIHDWIKQLKPTATAEGEATTQLSNSAPTLLEKQTAAAYDAIKAAHTFGKTTSDESALAAHCDVLLSSTTGALRAVYLLDTFKFSPAIKTKLIDQGAASTDPNIRDLFERFLPEERRVKRLGSVVDAAELLSLPGDIERGRKFFFEANAAACKNCHRIGTVGGQVGPDLSQIAKKLARPALLESILEPSKTIDPKFVSWQLETDEGQVYSGLLKERTDERVVLVDGTGKEIVVATDNIEVLVPQQKSLMPDLLFRDLTAAQLADLLAFLASLKE
jgi:putative heme-binding domain-containing protein